MSGLVFNRGGGKMSPKLMAIIISRPPTKTEYIDGDIFDPSGMEVLAVYSDGTSTVCTGYGFSPDTALTVGQTRVTITYSEGGTTAQTTVTINVKPRLLSVKVVRAPTKTVYELGESFDPTPMLLEAAYSDGSTKTIDQTQYRYPDAPFTAIGVVTIVISYAENGISVKAMNSVWVYETIQIPTQNGTLVYNEALQTPVWNGYDANKMTLGGVTAAENAGTYMATFTPGMYLRWPDGSEESVDVEWVIEKAPGSLSISTSLLNLSTASPTGSITVTKVGDGTITAVSSNTALAEVIVNGNTITVTGKASGYVQIAVSVAEGTNHLAPVSVTCNVELNFLSDIFSENSWSTIIAACDDYEANGTPLPEGWIVGSSKDMEIDGDMYQVDIIGIRADKLYNSNSYAALTLQLHDCYKDRLTMNVTTSGGTNNRSGWFGCTMEQTHLPGILALMPSEVQNGIKEVEKIAADSGNYDEEEAEYETGKCKLFLLSADEIKNSTGGNSAGGEGLRYEYYRNGNSPVKNYDGAASIWWTRSAYMFNSSSYCTIDKTGAVGYRKANQSAGVAFAFCF